MWSLSKAGRIERLVTFKFLDGAYVPVGLLIIEGNAHRRQGRFAYAESYLARRSERPIDPVGLPLKRKWQPADPEEVHLAFHDCGPDGWGKGILDMAFPDLKLGMPEYLALGTLKRTGDLAFGPSPDVGPLTWEPADRPLLALPDDADDLEALVTAAQAIDEGDAKPSHLALLVRASPDVGGARPKARLRHDGSDWIAKFPAWGDKFDDPKMEAVCLDVAEAAGIETPDRELVTVGKRSVLLVRRFDRGGTGAPLAYLSAGTLLGESASAYGTPKTYADIAEVGRRIGASRMAEDMFRRFLLNSFLHNTDDHLRNHAFINDGTAWRLAPVFDVVPTLGRDRHVCAPARGMSPAWDPTNAFKAHEGLRLKELDAEVIFDEVVKAMSRIDEFMEAREVVEDDRKLLHGALASRGRPVWKRGSGTHDGIGSTCDAAEERTNASTGCERDEGPETWLKLIVTRAELDEVIEGRAGRDGGARGDDGPNPIVRFLIEAKRYIRFQTFLNADGSPILFGIDGILALRKGFGSATHRSIHVSAQEMSADGHPMIAEGLTALRAAAIEASGVRGFDRPVSVQESKAPGR